MPPKQPQVDPQYLDEFHQKLSEDAALYFDEDEDERTAFIETMLERRGYQRTAAWAPPPPPDPNAQPPGGGQAGKPQGPAYFKHR